MDEPRLRPESVVVAAGRPDAPGAPVTTPIVLTAPYRHAPDENRYSRSAGTDTAGGLRGRRSASSRAGPRSAFASGMAAIAAVVESRPSGFVAVVPGGAYSGAVSIFAEQERLGRATVRRVDVADTDAVVRAVDGADLRLARDGHQPVDGGAGRAGDRRRGARARARWSRWTPRSRTPLGVRPLDLGVDVVMHSATKYLAGHSDLLMGVLVTRDADLHAELVVRRSLTRRRSGCAGVLPRHRAACARWPCGWNARSNPRACWPSGWPRTRASPACATRASPPTRGTRSRSRDHAGFGAMIGFEIDGDADDAERVCAAVRLITHATSLGGVESLLERRARHAVDAGFGTPPSLLRLSVGIEHVEDLWSDLRQALDAGR